MNLDTYFKNTKGLGVLSTSDSDGNVNAAIYARPHIVNDQTIAFVMAKRLTRQNLKSNEKAVYLFMEDNDGYKGTRLYLTKVKEENDPTVIDDFRRQRGKETYERYKGLDGSLVYFKIDKQLPLVGSN